MQRIGNRRRQRRGAVAVQVVVTLPVLLGLAAVTVDVGTLYNTRNDLQRTADAAALAAISVVAYTAPGDDPIPAATETAVNYVERNAVMGQDVTIEPDQDVVFGRAVYDSVTETYVFTPGDTPTNAVRVTVRMTENSPNGPAPLYFANIFGRSLANVSASATAMAVNMTKTQSDCWDDVPDGQVQMCDPTGDSDDSDDSASGDSDDSDDSDSGDSDGAHNGDSDDSDDSASGDSDDSDDSQASGDSTDSTDSGDSGGDSDDSDDSASGDSVDSDDSDSGDSDGAHNGDSDDSDDSASGDSDDSDDSQANEDSESADSSDSDASHTVTVDENAAPLLENEGATPGPCNCVVGDSDDSDDSEGGDSGDSDDSDGDGPGTGNGQEKVTICHIPPGNPENAHTITVAQPAVNAHLAHGDTLGPCPVGTGGDVRIFLIN